MTPALVASLDLVDQKDLRLRGPLVSVDTTAGTYIADLRPFNMHDQHFGQVTVHTRRQYGLRSQRHQLHRQRRSLAALNTAGAGTATAAYRHFDHGHARVRRPRPSTPAPVSPVRAWIPSSVT